MQADSHVRAWRWHKTVDITWHYNTKTFTAKGRDGTPWDVESEIDDGGCSVVTLVGRSQI